MAIRFVIGRAGAGKSAHCIRSVCDELLDDPLRGPPLLLIVPEQAGLQTERRLIETPGMVAYHRARVISFQRLAREIVRDFGDDPPQEITPQRRFMMIARVLSQERPALRYFGAVRRSVGFQRELAMLFERLIAEGATPQRLRDAASADAPPMQQHRLDDVALLFEAYQEIVGEHRIDPAQVCFQAAEALPEASPWTETRVWVDGFASFSAAERALLLRLARVASNIDVSLLLDPASAVLGPDGGPVEPFDLFAPTARTYVALSQNCHARGIEIAAPLVLDPAPPPRFGQAPGLAALEANLFGVVAPKDAAAPPPAEVSVVQCADARAEVEYVCERIRALVSTTEPQTYLREVAIVARDLSQYADFFEAALAADRIPCFIDRRRTVAHHPFVNLVRAMVRVETENYALDAMRSLIKSGLLPNDAADLDATENFLLAHGIEGRRLWTESDWTFRSRHGYTFAGARKVDVDQQKRVNAVRKSVVAALEPWTSAVAGVENATAKDYCAALFASLEALDVANRLDAMALAAADDGDPATANLHRQIFGEFVELLDDMADVLGDDRMALDRWADVMDAALGSWTVGLAPPTVDQVLVGQIDRSRQPAVKHVFLVGFNQGVFPATPPADTILGDEQRSALTAAGVDLGVDRREQVLDERLLAYIAATRASGSLCITFRAQDEAGRPCEPSPYLADICQALPGLAVAVRPPTDRSNQLDRALNEYALCAAMASEMRTRPLESADDALTDVRAKANAVYAQLRDHATLATLLGHAFSGLRDPRDAELSPDAVALLYPPDLTLSLAAIEHYAACPFQYFAQNGIRLEPRATHALDPLDVGTLSHAVLERIYEQLLSEGRRIDELDDDAMRDRLAAAVAHVVATLGEQLVASDGRLDYLVARQKHDIGLWLHRARHRARSGRFVPKRLETSFGLDHEKGGLPALEIETPGGRRVRIRGRIDRIDLTEIGGELAGMVIDYKHSKDRKLSLDGVLFGLELQLMGYLLALQQQGESLAGRPIRPSGAFYDSLKTAYNKVASPLDAPDDDDDLGGRQQLRGAFDLAALGALDGAVLSGGRSNVVSAFVKKDGEPGHESTTDVLRSKPFDALLRRTRRRIGELADRMLDGDVSVRPYLLDGKLPCQWCNFQAVCRFEPLSARARVLEKKDRKAVLDLLESEDAS